jgi:SAM-dependent methyltransferase
VGKIRALRAYVRERERAEQLREQRLSKGQSVEDLQVGSETLRRMATVGRYNDWIWDRLSPYVGRRILEVGCGLGNFTHYFLDRDLVVSVDPVPEAIETVSGRFLHHDHMVPTVGDITDDALIARLKGCHFDTVVCLNVLEHIPDDEKALANMHQALAPGGRLLLLVPQGRALYGTLDYYLDHYRRYKYSEVLRLMRAAGFTIEDSFSMNIPGMFGWYLNSRILRRSILPSGQLKLFNTITPVVRGIEERIKVPVGISVVAIGRKEQV